MVTDPELVPSGGVTSPRGFLAGATGASIKKTQPHKLDLGILFSEYESTAAAVFTTNRIKAAPVLLDMERVKDGKARAVVVNSGCANACTGDQGMADAIEMAALAAGYTGLPPEQVLVASTGVIGTRLPMERIRTGIRQVRLSIEGGHDLARAIMTTDTFPKEVAVKTAGFTIGGVAKGSGMIHPDLATMLCFLTTDAGVEAGFLKKCLKKAVDISFNMISIDGDTSTNDTVILLANGRAGTGQITEASPLADDFQRALETVCVHLAKACARDGEGATRLIEVNVRGAATRQEARQVARTIVSSPLVKTAVHGADPNWGRVLAAAGRCSATLDPEKLGLSIGKTRLVDRGVPLDFDRDEVVRHLKQKEVLIELDLHLGRGEATAWGCDLSPEYVKINAEYTT